MSVIEWLESPEGEQWSRWMHEIPVRGNQLVSVVDDIDGSNHAFIWYA